MISGTAKESPARFPVIVIFSAIAVFAATATLSSVLFQHIPHVHDEIAYLFQAKIFSLGRLYVPSPAGRESFDFPHIVNNGKWYSQYPPGFPLLLLPALLAGIPWITNPLFAALSILMLYLLGKELYGEVEGRLGAVLGSVSIWLLLTSSTLLSHTSALFFFLVFLLLMARSSKAPTLGNGFLAGLAIGAAFLIRPYDVAAVSVPALVYFGLRSVAEIRVRWKNAAGFGVALLGAVALLLIYNQITNGDPFKMGYIVRYGEDHGIGFGRGGYVGVPHTPSRGLFWLGENLKSINTYLFGWPLSSLFFLIPFMVPLKEGRERARTDALLVLSFLSLSGGMFIYWGSYVFIGPRLFFLGLPLLILMTVRGVLKIPGIIFAVTKSDRRAQCQKFTYFLIGLMTLFAFAWTFPRWIMPPASQSYFEVFNKDFCGVTDRIHGTMRSLPLRRSLVIIKFLYEPQHHFPDGWWGSGFMANDPLLQNHVIYAQDRGPINASLPALYPERDIYLFMGTLVRGMLVPIEQTGNGQLRYGPPVIFRAPSKDYIDLVGSPQQIFRSYSHDFQVRLDKLFVEYPFLDINVGRLTKLSERAKDADDPRLAIFCLEAALQIENDAVTRYQLLTRLATLYTRFGRKSDATLIMERLFRYKDPHVYNVFPEKGF